MGPIEGRKVEWPKVEREPIEGRKVEWPKVEREPIEGPMVEWPKVEREPIEGRKVEWPKVEREPIEGPMVEHLARTKLFGASFPSDYTHVNEKVGLGDNPFSTQFRELAGFDGFLLLHALALSPYICNYVMNFVKWKYACSWENLVIRSSIYGTQISVDLIQRLF